MRIIFSHAKHSRLSSRYAPNHFDANFEWAVIYTCITIFHPTHILSQTGDDNAQSTSAAPASVARNGVGVYSSRVSGKLARVQAANAAYQAALPVASPANNADSAGAATVPFKAPKSNAPVLAFSSFTKSGSGAAPSSSNPSALSIAEQAFQAAISMRASRTESDDEDKDALKLAKLSASLHRAPTSAFQFTYSNDSDDGGEAEDEKSKRKRHRKEERRLARAAEHAAIVEEQVDDADEDADAAKARRKQEKRERKRAEAAAAEDAAAEKASAAPVEQESSEDRAARKAAKKLLKRKNAE
jgi:hypothetical protein